MIYLALFVTVTLLGMLGIALANAFSLLRLQSANVQGAASPEDAAPLISVLIPARNEASVIGQTVRDLLAQQYPAFELILLDDHSTDGTAATALAAAGDDTRLLVLAGATLPAGWWGKNWACHQLAQAAAGDWLLFADADVRWEPGALAALAAQLRGATPEAAAPDLLTVWPTQVTQRWAERLVVPLMALTVIGYLPWLLVHHSPWAVFAAANGQCMVFRRAAYQRIGGHAAVRSGIIEDILLARKIKQAGLRLRMADANGLIRCRMYDGWLAVRDGYAKNILAGYGSALALILATVFHWLIFLGPWLWFFLGGGPGWPWWPLLLAAAGLLLRGLTASLTRQRVFPDALLLPLSVLLMTVIAARALWWHWRYGGPIWKGRTISV